MTKRKIKKGDVWSRHSFGSVVDVGAAAITVQNEYGKTWQVGPDLFNDEFLAVSSDPLDYVTIAKLSQTDLASKFEEFSRTAVTVNFNKKLDPKDLMAKVSDAFASSKNKPAAEAEVRRILQENLAGEERTLVGFHYGARDTFGRLHFTLVETDKNGQQTSLRPTDNSYDKRHRLVDPRTINWFIADGVKYVAK